MIKLKIEKDKNGSYYLTNGFMSVVAVRFKTEQRAINFARKEYGEDIVPRHIDSAMPDKLAEIVEKY